VPTYGELWPTSVWDPLAHLGHSSKFQRLSHLGLVTAASLNGSQPNFAQCLAISWVGRLFIHFRRLLPRNAILPGAKFTLRPPSLALSYIGSVTARHSSSGREPNFAALSTRRHLYSAGRPSRWALAHILVSNYFDHLLLLQMYMIMVTFHQLQWSCHENAAAALFLDNINNYYQCLMEMMTNVTADVLQYRKLLNR